MSANIDDRIDELETERERLRAREGEFDRTQDADVERLEAIRVELDQLFDLKRRRQAAVDAGEDPDSVRERPASEVEGYQQ
jgi:predicted nuclease with TOPRIM domain